MDRRKLRHPCGCDLYPRIVAPYDKTVMLCSIKQRGFENAFTFCELQ